ncbi:MAG: acyl-CoA dehydrogenase family protein [Blastocatellia bacterium]|nr:acyl-CoA dehydrogenase family protein [Blastocatellia bacterium]MBL8192505.1 acyl-CoA dehydrogenase family protein [Blastocatellia bacterium]MBN8723773.1 acyl-CoA dehydrogenase family protein [Acidobacteriota bacterium]
MAKFKGVDFYDIDSLLTEEERLTRDSVRNFVEEKIVPIIEECYEHARFPTELVKPLGELGVLGASLPTEYGCAGLGAVAYGLVIQEIERGDSGIRSFSSVQGSLVMYPIYAFGSEEQKRKWLPAMAKGDKIGCFGLTEPDFGSNPSGMITRAKRTSNGWLLNGTKTWITNGTIADVAVVWAKTDDNDMIRGFLVEKGTPGFTAPEIHRKHSLRASVTSELVFSDCEIPEENILPLSKGLKSPLMCLSQARYGISWGAIGSAMACYHTALDYAQGRIQFGKPISAFQLQQAKFADMLTEITKAQLLSLQLGRLKEQGKITPAQISMAKRNNVHMAMEVARAARTILGANGISGDYPIMRHMNNLESVYTYEGTHDIHTLVLGAEITGHQAFD